MFNDKFVEYQLIYRARIILATCARMICCCHECGRCQFWIYTPTF